MQITKYKIKGKTSKVTMATTKKRQNKPELTVKQQKREKKSTKKLPINFKRKQRSKGKEKSIKDLKHL